MRALVTAIGLTFFVGAAHAVEVTIDLLGEVDETTIDYACEGGQPMTVRYINGAAASLAIFDWQGQRYVASAAISGSGVRYVADRFVWWTRGEEATLFDELAGADADPLASCAEN